MSSLFLKLRCKDGRKHTRTPDLEFCGLIYFVGKCEDHNHGFDVFPGSFCLLAIEVVNSREISASYKLVFMQVRTFQVIVAQGLAGQIPWQAISFATLWLELMGFKRIDAAISVGLLSVGNMLGSVFGGWVGDFSAQLSPNAGRILCAQFSALIGIPLSGILLLGLPQVSAPAWAYGFVLFLMGFLMSWNSPATNWPIFSEIVPTHLHTTVFAIDSMIEKSLAAAGAPLVGILAERLFGYASQKGTSGSDLDNANAIAKGLFSLMTIPFFLCFLIINLLYFTYPRDRDRVKKASPEVH
jgi:hypothetical protein